VSNGGAFISSISASDKPLVVQAAVSQSGNLIEAQNSSGTSLFNVSSAGAVTAASNLTVQGGTATLGTSSSVAGSLVVYDANGQKATITLGDIAADRALSIPVATGSDTFCLQTLNNCSGASGANTALSNLASVAINTDLQFANTGNRTVNIAATGAGVAGRSLTIQGGNSGTGAVNGGDLILQAGATGGTGTTGSVTVKANGTNSTTAFQVQNASSVAQLTVDATNARLYVGPTAGDTVGTLLVLGNKTDYTNHSNSSSEPTGVAGGMYYNSGLKQFRCYEVDHWRDCIVSARTSFRYINDFISNNADSVVGSSLGGSGTGSGGSMGTAVIGHPGIQTYTTGSTNAGWAGPGSADNGTYVLGNGDYWRYEAMLRVPTLSDTAGNQVYTVRTGMFDGTNTDGSVGCFFKYSDGVNSGKWQGVCKSGGNTGTCDTTTTVAINTWYRLTISYNAAGTSIDFAINGVSKCQVTGASVPNNQAVSWNNIITKSVGTTARTMDLDYIEVEGQFGTAR
jgi:hypothetical protein